ISRIESNDMSTQQTPGPWRPADEMMAGECERLFQNGGPKVYMLRRDGSRELIPTNLSATRVARSLSPGAAVFARRKVGGKYTWMCIVRRAAIAKTEGGAA